jgi:ankyrin repeat protein
VDIDEELIKSRDIKKVKELLERGANPNAKDKRGGPLYITLLMLEA